METLSGLQTFCDGNPLVIDGFPSQRASNMELWCCFSCRLQWGFMFHQHSAWNWCMCEKTIFFLCGFHHVIPGVGWENFSHASSGLTCSKQYCRHKYLRILHGFSQLPVAGFPIPGKNNFILNRTPGADSIQIGCLTRIGIPTVEIRRSYDRLISTMEFAILAV